MFWDLLCTGFDCFCNGFVMDFDDSNSISFGFGAGFVSGSVGFGLVSKFVSDFWSVWDRFSIYSPKV